MKYKKKNHINYLRTQIELIRNILKYFNKRKEKKNKENNITEWKKIGK